MSAVIKQETFSFLPPGEAEGETHVEVQQYCQRHVRTGQNLNRLLQNHL